MIDAVIFDLDGTLVDSEPNYRDVDERFLRDHGIALKPAEWREVVGLGGEPFVELLRERYGLERAAADFIREKDERYLAYACGRTRAFPRIVALVRYLAVHGFRLGVGTSSRSFVLRAMLDETGIRRWFGATVGSDEVGRSKPAPDIFLEVARRLGVDPGACLVLEDSVYGVQAAKRAGMRVVALPSHDADPAAFADADLVVPGGPEALDPDSLARRFALVRVDPADLPRADLPGADRPRTDVAARLQDAVYDHYAREGRRFPWRDTDDPYAILVSEYMLQQTQASRVVPKYLAFLERFPTVTALAGAPLGSVLEAWQGLGYNRRARSLREAAVIIRDRHGGEVPGVPAALLQLPGVGRYTAAAVLAFAFRRPETVVETNIRRVYLHLLFPALTDVTDRSVEAAVSATVDRRDPRRWYYALMDYGAHLGRILPNPNVRSRPYTRQSAFAGSVRQVRGAVLRILTAHGPQSLRDLERRLGATDHRFLPAVEALVSEGLVTRSDDRLRIAD